MSRAKTLPRITRITVHHDGMTAFRTTSKQSAMARIESIRRAHVRQGWADIGYHYVIDPAGRVYEARSTRLQGAHVKYNNEENLGILVLGNYNSQPVTSETRAAIDGFVGSAMRRHGVPVGRVQTHQEIRPTACPGRSLQAQMNDARASRGALRRA